jgi:hypothetical protein
VQRTRRLRSLSERFVFQLFTVHLRSFRRGSDCIGWLTVDVMFRVLVQGAVEEVGEFSYFSQFFEGLFLLLSLLVDFVFEL